MTTTVELNLMGPMDHLRIAWQTGETLLESVPFREDPDGTRYNTLLAVQEMVTNVLRHANKSADDMPIRIRFRADAESFEVQLMDRGDPFDPRIHAATPPDASSMPEVPGGYGILIATMVMDVIDWQRENGWNVLTMTKLVSAPATVGVAAAPSRG